MSPSLEINEEAAARIRGLERRVRRLETLEPVGGGGDFVLLEHQELEAANSVIDFDTVSQLYTHLFIIHSTLGPTDFGDGTLTVQFNGDTGANYISVSTLFTSTPASITGSTATGTSMPVGSEGRQIPNRFGAGFILIPDYKSTLKHKAARAGSYFPANITFTNSILGGTWENLAAITSLHFELSTGDFRPGSIISLYGIR